MDVCRLLRVGVRVNVSLGKMGVGGSFFALLPPHPRFSFFLNYMFLTRGVVPGTAAQTLLHL